MDPFTAAALGAGASFGISSLFGKKGKKAKLPPPPSLTAEGRGAQKTLYSAIQRGMAGGGLTGYNRFGPMRAALGEGYGEAKPMLASYLNRMVPRGDVKVRGYAQNMLKRSFYGGMQDLREQEQLEPFEQQQEAMNWAQDLLGQEKRLGTETMNIYNQSQAQLSQMPTFGSQMGYGLGSAGGIFAAQRYAQMMSNQGGA